MHLARFRESGGDDGLTALGAWLKELVMMVLLAVFADLLLPTKSMQKYVRTVLGLGIIAVIVQPVVPLLNPNWANQIAQMAVSEMADSNTTKTQGETVTASDYATTLQNEQQSAANHMVENQLMSVLPDQFRKSVASITVTGAASGTNATRVAIVRMPGTVTSKELQDWASNLLGISTGQISVTN